MRVSPSSLCEIASVFVHLRSISGQLEMTDGLSVGFCWQSGLSSGSLHSTNSATIRALSCHFSIFQRPVRRGLGRLQSLVCVLKLIRSFSDVLFL